jgi:signal transduction histidine kinase/rhodanese-related sulfurtransferase
VVFYEDRFTLKSPRGLAILKYLGYDEERIKVLDGGCHNWYKENFRITAETIKNEEKDFIVNVDEHFFVDYNEMLELIYDDRVIKLDVRDKDEWIGISSSPYGIDFAPKKGRLPNATWIEWYQFITNDMLSVESLEKIKHELQKKSIKVGDDIVLYCFKGARLSNSYIALRKLGYKKIRIYFAGWNEWCRKENAPIINEVENDNNPILQENIALKKRLDEINLKDAALIDFPKHNKEAIFAFDRDGNICFENEPKKKNLPNIKNITDVFPDLDTADRYNIIDNREERTISIEEGERYYLLNCIGSREANKILFYAFDTTELKQKDQQLFNQSRLAQMGEMISMIAHQWRQPLGAISTTSVNLQMKLELKAFDLETKEGVGEASEYFMQRLGNIDEYVNSLTTTIDDFRNFYKGNKRSVTTKLEAIVLRSLNIINASLISDNVEIIEEYGSEEKIELYDSEMMHVILNILKNAQDNFREKNIQKPYLKITTEDRRVSICDNGGGISEDIIDKIFDPYFSTKDEKNGTGLGLYMSKIIVEEHHGAIFSTINTEDGVCFVIEFKEKL